MFSHDAAAPTSILLRDFHRLLMHTVLLRQSFIAKYPSVQFDFVDMERAQRLPRYMRSVAHSPQDVDDALRNRDTLDTLRTKVADSNKNRPHHGSDGMTIEEVGHFPSERATTRASELGYQAPRGQYFGGMDTLRTKVAGAALARQVLRAHEHRDNRSNLEKFRWSVLRGCGLLAGMLARLQQLLHSHARDGHSATFAVEPQLIQRREGSDLSVREFLDMYAHPGRPVIIRGLHVTDADWTLDTFREKCGSAWVQVMRRSRPERKLWANLEPAADLSLAEFLGASRPHAIRQQWYLHDWHLPVHCPAVLGNPQNERFFVPKYFAGDYFQRASFAASNSWPSLFIGFNGTGSAMHIDRGGTNFWFLLLGGLKEWRVYGRLELVNLYKDSLMPHFHVDAFQPDAFQQDAPDTPLFKHATAQVVVQRPGELIFIPAGSPHAVRNLEDSHGLSMNYVDVSNLGMHLWSMLEEEQFAVVDRITNVKSFPHGLRSDQRAVGFHEWKRMHWNSIEYDIS